MKGGEGLAKALDKYRALKSITAEVGIIDGKTYPDGTPIAQVGFWNEYGTSTTPARPFFRSAVDGAKVSVKAILAGGVRNGDPEQAVRLASEFMMDELKTSVMTWSDPPNADSTIASKGYNAPLRGNDKLLRNSFGYEVIKDGN